MTRTTQGWCILRTSGASTMPLARALRESGFDAWTPIEIQTRRRPRSRNRYDQEAAIMPSYVFADAGRISELLILSKSPTQCYRVWDKDLRRFVTHGIPYFSVFRYGDRFPIIADGSLEPLRVIERRVGPKQCYNPGDRVKLVDGGFAGMSGVVEGTQGQFILVSFAGFHQPIKIASFHLHPGVIENGARDAAKAA